jgi:hypothetical protein
MYLIKHYTTKTDGGVELRLMHPKLWNNLEVSVTPSAPKKELRISQVRPQSLPGQYIEEEALCACWEQNSIP